MAVMTRELSARVLTRTPASIRSIAIHGKWVEVSDVQLIHFSVSESEAIPAKLYPALRYREGKGLPFVTTPLSRVDTFRFAEDE